MYTGALAENANVYIPRVANPGAWRAIVPLDMLRKLYIPL